MDFLPCPAVFNLCQSLDELDKFSHRSLAKYVVKMQVVFVVKASFFVATNGVSSTQAFGGRSLHPFVMLVNSHVKSMCMN